MSPKYFYSVFLIICFLFIIGCAVTTNEAQVENIPDRKPLDGIWSGEFDIGGRGPYDFTAVHINGHAFAYSLGAKAQCVGTVKLDGENYISKYALFALDGGPFDAATITGKLKEETRINSHFVTLNGGDTGALNIVYDAVYDTASSLQLTAGQWTYTDRDNLTTTLSIAPEGTIAGTDSDGCAYLGYVDLINPAYNVYKMKVEITECSSVNGEYEGVSFIKDDLLNVQIANEKYALFFAFGRAE